MKLAVSAGAVVACAFAVFGFSTRPAAQVAPETIQDLLDQRYELKAVFPDGKDRHLYFQKGSSLRVCSAASQGCSRLSKG